jgi:IrrE N-terminal-like domain
VKRIVPNKFLRQILSQVGEAEPSIAVHKLVQRYRETGDRLERVAERLGVHQITVTRMGFDGGIFEEPLGLHIKLNSETRPKRRRFTLAHELAHLIVASGNAGGARRSHACTELERTCDIVAAELLMPLDEMKRIVPQEASPASLLALADRFGASAQATAVRLHELDIWKASIGQWSWGGNARELWYVGRRFWQERTIYLGAFESAVRQGAYSGSELITSLGRGAFPVFFDVRRLGATRAYLIAVVRGSN